MGKTRGTKNISQWERQVDAALRSCQKASPLNMREIN